MGSGDNAAKPGPRVLLIDDSELCLRIESAVLTEAGFDVRTVPTLQKFVALLTTWRPELIISDLDMPEMRGEELCRWLKQHAETTRLPIVLCSATPLDRLAEIAKEVGADAYVSKLDGIDDLGARVRALCDEILW